MKIAIATARELIDTHGQEIIQFEESYAEYLAQFDFQLIVIPLMQDCEIFDHLNPSMILLPGGGDVPSQFYSSNVEAIQQSRRDSIEYSLIKFAISRDIPLLGICRGMQMINGFLGGKITREQSNQIAVNHNIRIPNCDTTYEVNSFHRDVIRFDSLSLSLKAIAFDDNCKHVEAFVGIKHRILGLQWHPERTDKPSLCRNYSNSLITALITKEGVL